MRVISEAEQIELLQHIPIFGGMKADNLAFLLSRATQKHFPQGSYLCREGEPANEFYVLEAGRVAIIKERHGHDFLLRHLEAGDCLGEMALIDLFPRSASALAETECLALSFSAPALMGLYQRDLEQFALIQMNLARELSRRLRHASDLLFETNIPAGISESGELYSSL